MSDRETAPYRRIAELERENAALREQIDDWENAVLHARDNRSEEQHCTCVAPLLGKLKQLERENAALRKERDSYRYRSEQIWGLRKEIQAALGVPADCEGEEALKRGLESIKLLRSTAVETCALARVWATVWHDKLSAESIQRFAELEEQILKRAKP
jgi:hypothetical protein